MATLTVVITYTGTLGAPDAEVQSYTSAGTAFASLTGAELTASRDLMVKAVKAAGAAHASKMHAA